MCLIIKNKTPLIAQKDIECYKMMYYFSEIKNLIPFFIRSYKYQIGEVCEAEGDSELLYSFGSYKVTSGYFHSYIEYDELLKEYEYWKEDCPQLCLIKCIIPKGTKYYQGHHSQNSRIKNYASEKIIFKEIINI